MVHLVGVIVDEDEEAEIVSGNLLEKLFISHELQQELLLLEMEAMNQPQYSLQIAVNEMPHYISIQIFITVEHLISTHTMLHNMHDQVHVSHLIKNDYVQETELFIQIEHDFLQDEW